MQLTPTPISITCCLCHQIVTKGICISSSWRNACTPRASNSQGFSSAAKCLAGVQSWSGSALKMDGRLCVQPINQTQQHLLSFHPPPSLFPIARHLSLPALSPIHFSDKSNNLDTYFSRTASLVLISRLFPHCFPIFPQIYPSNPPCIFKV